MQSIRLDQERFEAICGQLTRGSLDGADAASQLQAAVLPEPSDATHPQAAFDFNSMDTNTDGSLSQSELMAGLSDHGHSAEEIERLFFALDVDGDMRVSQPEFLQGYRAVCQLQYVSEVPVELRDKYTDWVRLNGCPGGCQFSTITGPDGVIQPLAFTAIIPDCGQPVFVKTFKPKYQQEASREWSITEQFLQPAHPNVSSMID